MLGGGYDQGGSVVSIVVPTNRWRQHNSSVCVEDGSAKAISIENAYVVCCWEAAHQLRLHRRWIREGDFYRKCDEA